MPVIMIPVSIKSSSADCCTCTDATCSSKQSRMDVFDHAVPVASQVSTVQLVGYHRSKGS